MYTVYTTVRRRSTSTISALLLVMIIYLGRPVNMRTSMRRQKWHSMRHVPESGLHECQGDVRTVGIPTYVSDKMQLAGGKDGVWVWGWIYRTGKGYVYAYM